MCVGAQRPRAPPSALLLLGLALGSAAKLTCTGNTYPRGSKCCQDCPPGEQLAVGQGIGTGDLEDVGMRVRSGA